MTLPQGTTQPGERILVMTEELFMSLIESTAAQEEKVLTVDWGGPTTATITFFAPTIYESAEDDDPTRPEDGEADPLSLVETGE